MCCGNPNQEVTQAPEPEPVYPVKVKYLGDLAGTSPFTGEVTKARREFGRWARINTIDLLDAPGYLFRKLTGGGAEFELQQPDEDIPQANFDQVISLLGDKVGQVQIASA